MMSRFHRWLAAAVMAIAAASTSSGAAPFDLAGPSIRVTVTRGTTTLPISEVPNLAPGDRLWIKAELPATQSEHYLLVAAFLRGATDPPPADWFFRNETWNRKSAPQGMTITVPPDAQQALLFLAPQTGGDFRTLVDAVRGRPGAFVRASQDLNQATLDRSRLLSYLAAVAALDQGNPADLKNAAPLLARSLAIKVEEKCLDRIPELRAACLTEGQDTLILNDGHSTSIVEALTSGPASDLAMEASSTPQLNYGYYSPYLASVLDIARIFDSFRTAKYQYIPALGSHQGDQLTLTLNTPPSFHNPKSVLVAALPAVEKAKLPPLHAVDPKEVYCASRTSPVFPVEGAPLVFSTAFAHDMVLRLTGRDGKTVDLPAKADAQRGGFIADTSSLAAASLGDALQGSLRGYWGFDEYAGPGFQVVNAHAQIWALASGDQDSLIAGREDVVHLRAGSVGCIERVMLMDPAGKEMKIDWKAVKPNEVELKLPLQDAKPGAATLLVSEYGASQPQSMPLQIFADAGHRDQFSVHAGDTAGILKGSRLDEVDSLTLKGVRFVPEPSDSGGRGDELPMAAADASSISALREDDAAMARITLKDGRVFDVKSQVTAPRPRVTLIGKSIHSAAATDGAHIQLTDPDELPQGAELTFSLRSQTAQPFARDMKVEVSSDDESFSATLTRENAGLVFADPLVAVAKLDPATAFGPSAFGALKFRVVTASATSDWQRLAILVRLPVLTDLACPSDPALACKLSGSNLFLVDSVASTAQFDHPVQVPDGFPGDALPVPAPVGGQLYVKLRDDPQVINSARLTARQLPPLASPPVPSPPAAAPAAPTP
jgi:hypothetical protein